MGAGSGERGHASESEWGGNRPVSGSGDSRLQQACGLTSVWHTCYHSMTSRQGHHLYANDPIVLWWKFQRRHGRNLHVLQVVVSASLKHLNGVSYGGSYQREHAIASQTTLLVADAYAAKLGASHFI